MEVKIYGIFMVVFIFGIVVNIWGNCILVLWSKVVCKLYYMICKYVLYLRLIEF